MTHRVPQHLHRAFQVPVDVAAFSGNLTSDDYTVQRALETLDQTAGGSGDSNYGGDYADRPSTTNTGDTFWPDDGVVAEKYDGSEWRQWGPKYPFIKPDPTAFTWVNQGGATYTDAGGATHLYDPATATWNMRILKKAAPTPPYTAIAAFSPSYHFMANYIGFGMIFRQASNGYIAAASLYSVNGVPSLYSDTMTDVNGGGAAVYSGPHYIHLWGSAIWFSISDDNTNRIVRFSSDGLNFHTIHTVARTNHITADEIGIFWTTRNGTYPLGLQWHSYKELAS